MQISVNLSYAGGNILRGLFKTKLKKRYSGVYKNPKASFLL